jgi:hypothetical protein
MRSPSIVPGFDADVYLVLDDFGELGRAYREVDENQADRATVIRWVIEGQYNNPVRIVCFNRAEGSACDVTAEIAREIKDWSERKGEGLSPALRKWIDWQIELGVRSTSHAYPPTPERRRPAAGSPRLCP